MGRLTKEMKKAELMEQLTEANEAYSMKGVQRKPPIDYLWEFIDLHCEKVDYETFCPTTDLKNAYENYCEEKGVCPCSPIVINKCIPGGWMMTVPWWMNFPPLSRTWWNMISLS